jgi:hypothetical protein
MWSLPGTRRRPRRLATNRVAAVPVFDSVVAVLDRLIEPSPVTTPKPAHEKERKATAADPTDPTLFGFI